MYHKLHVFYSMNITKELKERLFTAIVILSYKHSTLLNVYAQRPPKVLERQGQGQMILLFNRKHLGLRTKDHYETINHNFRSFTL